MARLTGVMGGMFDPVHAGHITAAREAARVCGLRRVLLVPCGNPVHRDKASADATHRVAMLGLAIEGAPELEIDTRECESAEPSRTYDTLLQLRRERSGESLCLIVGMDAFLSLEQWYRWRELFTLAHLLVITRPGFDEGEITAHPALEREFKERRVAQAAVLRDTNAGLILLMHGDTPDVSSTQLRELLRKRAATADVVPPAVLQYIADNRLYL